MIFFKNCVTIQLITYKNSSNGVQCPSTYMHTLSLLKQLKMCQWIAHISRKLFTRVISSAGIRTGFLLIDIGVFGPVPDSLSSKVCYGIPSVLASASLLTVSDKKLCFCCQPWLTGHFSPFFVCKLGGHLQACNTNIDFRKMKTILLIIKWGGLTLATTYLSFLEISAQ